MFEAHVLALHETFLSSEDDSLISSNTANSLVAAMLLVGQDQKIQKAQKELKQFMQDKVVSLASNDVLDLLRTTTPENFETNKVKSCLGKCSKFPAEAQELLPNFLSTVLTVFIAKASFGPKG